MKKSISELITAVLLLSLFTSCGDLSENVTNAENETSPNETTQEAIEKKDFEGKTFRIIGTNGAMNNFPEDEENGETINDTLYQRDRYVQELCNTEIEYVAESSGTCTTKFRNSILAQENEYSMLVDAATQICKITAEGVLADINELPYIATDSNYWSNLTAQNCQVVGKLYFLCGDIMPVIYTIPSCIFMNINIAEDYKITADDIYNTVLDDKWTLDKLISFTKDISVDLNNDDIISADEDFVGYLTESGQLAASVLAVGSGIELCEYDNSGKLSVNLMTEKVFSLIEKVQPLVEYASGGGDNFHATFTSDRALFSQHYTSSAYTRYRDMRSDFAILPIPKYNEEQTSYYSLMNPWGAAFVAFPSNADTEFVGYVAENMAIYSYNNLRNAVYEEAFKLKGARDDFSAKMLDLIFDNLYLDNNAIYNFGGSTTVLSDAIFNKADFASEFAGIETKIQSDIDNVEKVY